MDKLKKCPFCGGESRIEQIPSGSWDKFVATCKNPKCCAYYIGYCDEGLYDTRGKAVAAWNTRKPMERIAEWLEEHYKEAHRDAEKYKGKIAFGRYLAFKDAIKIVKEETDHEESDIISGTTSGS